MELDRETRTKVKDLARYALINEFRRKPFKRDDLSKYVALGDKSRQFDKLLEGCNKELASTFGMELIEMRPRGLNAEQVGIQNEIHRQAVKNSQSQRDGEPVKTPKGKGGSTRQYILRSRLDPELIDKVGKIVDAEIPDRDANEDEWSRSDGSILDWKHGDELGQMGLLGFVLALILMQGRTIDNRQLLIYLKRLKVQDTWKPPSTPACAHPPPDLEALLSQFCKQGYLEYTQQGAKAGSSGPSQANLRRQSQGGLSEANQNIEWRWGARAEIEFGEKQIAEFMSDIYRSAKGRNNNQSQLEASAREPDGTNRRPANVTHEKLMNDITKAAGSELQDSSALHMAGRSAAPAELEAV